MSASRATDEGGSFDPRYSRAFQRGADGSRDTGFQVTFDGPAPGAVNRGGVIRDASTRDASNRSGVSGGTPNGAARSPYADERPGSMVPVLPVPVDVADGDAAPASVTQPATRADAARRANERRRWVAYSVAIGCVSAGCMAIGLVMVVSAYYAYNTISATSQPDFFWPQLASQLGPWFFVVGLAAGVGLLFLHAGRWRPGR